MYYPYLRGKQNELLLLKENAELISKSSVVPIVEPVRKSLGGLVRSLSSLMEHNARFIVIVNPMVGDLADDSEQYKKFKQEIFDELLSEYDNCCIGFTLTEDSNLEEVSEFLAEFPNREIAFIHYGLSNGKGISELTNDNENVTCNVFINRHNGNLYRKYFLNNGKDNVLIVDAFHKKSNREYPAHEFFSEIHLTYDSMGMTGFGDFLIMPDEYQDSGGPAWAVAIHLTYINVEDQDQLYIFHFISDTTDTPTDPGGKFKEALEKLISEINDNDHIYDTAALNEFKRLYESQHYPGLGYVKKISMQHHVETIATFIGS